MFERGNAALLKRREGPQPTKVRRSKMMLGCGDCCSRTPLAPGEPARKISAWMRAYEGGCRKTAHAV